MSKPDDETPPEDPVQKEAGPEETPADPDKVAAEADGTSPDTPEQIIADLKDRLLRTMADMENLRNRSRREQEDALKYANTNFARDLLNVGDNLRRALESVPDDVEQESEALKTLKEGIEMTGRELQSVFERHGISEINPVGEKFDHNAHQAMFKVPGSGSPPGTVVQVMQVGYMLRDRLLRPAMVGVAAANDESNGNDSGGGGEGKPGPQGVDTTA